MSFKSRFIEMFGTVKNNSKNFPNTTIEASCKILDSMRIPITASDRKPGPYPYYGANGIQDSVESYIFDGNYVLIAEDGGHFNEIGRVAYSICGKCWVNNHAHILQPLDVLNTCYLENALNTIDFSSEVNGTTRQKLTQAAMRKIVLLLPPIELQNQFAEFVKQVDKSKFIFTEFGGLFLQYVLQHQPYYIIQNILFCVTNVPRQPNNRSGCNRHVRISNS